MTSKTKPVRGAFAAVALGLGALLAACGSDDSHGSTGGTDAAAATDGTVGADGGMADTGSPTDGATTDVGADGGVDASGPCTGLQCDVVDCADAGTGNASTTLHGTVYAPNGTLPLWNVDVYVPSSDPGPITPGLAATCATCGAPLPGNPVTATKTREDGTFVLPDVPVADDLPVVIQIGKWRKRLTLHTRPTACMPNALPATDTTLPRSMTDTGGDVVGVDMPQIAVSTGAADALECLLRKIGIADSEFTTDAQGGRVQLFADTLSAGQGANKFQTGFAGGSGNFSDSQSLWNTYEKLATYDITLLSCEGARYANTKSQVAMNAMKEYADHGGRILMSHLQNVWIQGGPGADGGVEAPATWPSLATFDNGPVIQLPASSSITIDETANPHGASFAVWLTDVMASATRDLVRLQDGTGKKSCLSIDGMRAEQWAYLDGTHSGAVTGVQGFQFTTPIEMPVSGRCGKVVFSDTHVSGDSTSHAADGFPIDCSASGLTAQEKALVFMFFDAQSCIDVTAP